MHKAPATWKMPISGRSLCMSRLTPGLLAICGLLSVATVARHSVAQTPQGGGGLHTVSPPSGGQIVYGTLENQASQSAGMVYMLRQVHGHYGDKPELGKLVQARDGSSLAAFFTLNDKNFSHTQQAGMVMVATVNGQMMAAVLTDDIKRFPSSEPGMVRTLMNAWHPAASSRSGGSASSWGSSSTPSASQAGRQTLSYASQKLYPATGGDRSATIDLPPDWKVTGVGGGQVTAEGPNGEFLGAALIWQNLPQARSSDLFRYYVDSANFIRQRARKPQMSFQLLSQQPIGKGQYNSGAGIIAYFIVDMHEGAGPCKGVVQVAPMGPGALGVTETWIPVRLYDAEQPMMVKIVNSEHQSTRVISAEGAADMDRIRQQGVRNQIQTDAINARSDASAKSYESQRNATNARNNIGGTQQATGNSHFDDINAGSEDMQNYILDRSTIQSTSTGAYGTFSDSFADDVVKNNPDKLQIKSNRQLLANGAW
jgi:hypothetical protein